VQASELVVRGHVVGTARGRVVGDGEQAVVSRLVTVEIDEVLAGTAAAPTVLVEEEGWLVDGTPIEVNGLPPSADGLDAVWFLDAMAADDVPSYLVVNHQGRYDLVGDLLRGAEVDDPLVHEATQLALRGEHIAGRPLDLLHADSAGKARDMLAADRQIDLILLDVVMETEDAGLRLVPVIRNELGQKNLRIVIRTGQPGCEEGNQQADQSAADDRDPVASSRAAIPKRIERGLHICGKNAAPRRNLIRDRSCHIDGDRESCLMRVKSKDRATD